MIGCFGFGQLMASGGYAALKKRVMDNNVLHPPNMHNCYIPGLVLVPLHPKP